MIIIITVVVVYFVQTSKMGRDTQKTIYTQLVIIKIVQAITEGLCLGRITLYISILIII